jgi:hypothetical protein
MSSENDFIKFVIGEISNNNEKNREYKGADKDFLIKNYKESFHSKQAIESVACLVDSRLRYNQNSNSIKNYYKANRSFNFILEIKNKIRTKSSSRDFVYIASFMNAIYLSCKVNKHREELKKSLEEENILIEYLIGKKCLNNLRFYVPNFVYTMSVFESNIINDKYWAEPMEYSAKNYTYFNEMNEITTITKEEYMDKQEKINLMLSTDPYLKKVLITEYVSRESLEYKIALSKIDFKEFLYIFCQLLLALEIAQRKYEFCHHDFNLSNILMKDVDETIDYKFNINCKQYEFYTTSIPVITNFGESTLRFKGRNIHNNNVKSQRVQSLIPGIDMLTFLIDTFELIDSLTGNLEKVKIFKEGLVELFAFYENLDDFNIYKIHKNNDTKELEKFYTRLKKGEIRFSKEFYGGKSMQKTPLEFLDWIIDNFEQKFGIRTERRDFINVRIDSDVNRLNRIIDGISISQEEMKLKLNRCMDEKNDTFIGLNYKNLIASRYINSIGYETFKGFNISDKEKDRLINNDIRMLNEVDLNIFEKYPEKYIASTFYGILQIKINIFSDEKGGTERNFEYFKEIFLAFDKAKKYVDLYYILLELKLPEIGYKKWIDDFENSQTFLIFKQYSNLHDVCERWLNSCNFFL